MRLRYILLFFGAFLQAQTYVSGNVTSEYHTVLQNVMIVNISTDKKVFTDNNGFFKIEAKTNDELRVLKDNFERESKVIQSNDFSIPLSIQLIRIPIEIKEVQLVIKLTGNLKIDTKKMKTNKKNTDFNIAMNKYMKEKLIEVQPKNNIPSSFAPPNLYAGQINLLGVLGLIINPKKTLGLKKHKLTFYEINDFYKKMKENFYGKYFQDYGLDEFKFESYLIYLDNKYELSLNYHDSFNKFELEQILKTELNNYLKNN